MIIAFLVAGLLMAGVEEYPEPLVRERQTVRVAGVSEVWELRWRTAPKVECGPVQDSLTCPCSGFAYGEQGEVSLVRLRDGAVVDRLELGQFFFAQKVVLQRWEANLKNDFDKLERSEYARGIAKRPVVQIMKFADYDHDDEASEFYLQTESPACGWQMGIVVGVSNANSKLHALGSVSAPKKPLVFRREVWGAVLKERGQVELVDQNCGDHGVEEEIVLRIESNPLGASGTRRYFACPRRAGQKALREEPL